MYPLTEDFPKALLSVAGRPVLDYLLDQLLFLQPLDSIHMVVNEKFVRHFTKWAQLWSPRLHENSKRLYLHNNGKLDNESRLGAIGDLVFTIEDGNLYDYSAIVSASDNIFLFELEQMVRTFVESPRNYVLALKETDPVRLRRSGVLQLGKDNLVIEFQEKPTNPASNLSCPSFYVLTRETIRSIPNYAKSINSLDALGHLISHLLKETNVYAYPMEGMRLDIGSTQDYHQANWLINRMSV
jgi:glucose-1-phosphate thymidylyltransferase